MTTPQSGDETVSEAFPSRLIPQAIKLRANLGTIPTHGAAV
jgi:hypothetical protein